MEVGFRYHLPPMLAVPRNRAEVADFTAQCVSHCTAQVTLVVCILSVHGSASPCIYGGGERVLRV